MYKYYQNYKYYHTITSFMNSEISVLENSKLLRKSVETAIEDWLDNNNQYVLMLDEDERLVLYFDHEITRESFIDGRWAMFGRLMDDTDYYETDDNYLSFVTAVGYADQLIRVAWSTIIGVMPYNMDIEEILE